MAIDAIDWPSLVLGFVAGAGSLGLAHIVHYLIARRRSSKRLSADYRFHCSDCELPPR